MYKYRKGSLLVELVCGLIILQGLAVCVDHELQTLATWRQQQRKYHQQQANFVVVQHLQHMLGGGVILGVKEHQIRIRHPRGMVYTLQQKKQALVSVAQTGGHFVLINHVQKITFKQMSKASFQMTVIQQEGQSDVQEVHI
ncbi:hypothetical protein D3P96_04920 [Weissella viridescens]|uniref:Competence protein ComGF n=1 Tax=Weissella viridescens TaxID=1629 RepID=A0A3P2RBT6_WEIVI|nr:hypothetical protein [Weissella viridescens]RRG18004.1 hypothetical protein D3P96_04920 [Weissella viridescens]